MALSLQKGQNFSLDKTDPGLNKVLIGLGWDPRATDGREFDLDASAFLLNASGKVNTHEDVVFYNQLKSTCRSVEHTGDNRTGEGDGDDESLIVTLSNVPADITRIPIAVTIHDAQNRGQNFGQVSNAFIRIENYETQTEIARFDLTEDASTETAMIFGELYRHGSDWKFKAVGQGYAGGLKALCEIYGVNF